MRTVILLGAALAGCGGGDDAATQPDAGGVVTVPTVVATTPIAGAIAVDPGVTITASFDEDMDPTSVAAAFVVRLDGTPVSGDVTYDAPTRVASFRVDAELALLGAYDATITADAVSAGGAALADDHAWSFTVREHWRAATLLDTEPATSFADSPEIAIDAAGNAIVVWSQWDGTRRNIWANQFAIGAGWGVAQLIEDGDEGYASWPKVAFDANGDAIAVWQQSGDGGEGGAGVNHIWTNRYTVGAGWGTPLLFEDGTCSGGAPCNGDADCPGAETCVDTTNAVEAQIAVSPAGDAFVVWERGTAARSVRARRYTPVGGWEASVLVGNGAVGARYPQVAVDATGVATVVWPEPDGIRSSIWARRFTPGAGWGAPAVVETDQGGAAQTPEIAVAADGVATVVWAHFDGTKDSVWSSRSNDGATWSAAAILEVAGGGVSYLPQIDANVAGEATAAWFQSDGTRNSIWVNRYLEGTGWGTAMLLETDDAGVADSVQLAADPSGKVFAVWSQSEGASLDIWARVFEPGSGWGAPTLLETEELGDALEPHIAAASGKAVTAWYQNTDGAVNSNVWGSWSE